MGAQHTVDGSRADVSVVVLRVVQAQLDEQVHVVAEKGRRLGLHQRKDGEDEVWVAQRGVRMVVPEDGVPPHRPVLSPRLMPAAQRAGRAADDGGCLARFIALVKQTESMLPLRLVEHVVLGP